MPTVKIIQVFNHYDDEYQATDSDVAQVTDWEEISDSDLMYLKAWVRDRNKNYRDPHYGVLLIPEKPISAIQSVKQVIDDYKKEEEKNEKKRKETADRYQATKLERKRKQLEKLKKELE